jgi:hypothetical protein
LASRLVINQPDAVSNIAVPTFETKLAVHITVNARCPNGPHREGAGSVGAAAVVRSAPLMTFSGNHIFTSGVITYQKEFPMVEKTLRDLFWRS